jgi:hypothetical protein
MSATEVDIAKLVATSRAAQGLPPKVSDLDVLARVAMIISTERDNASPPRGGAARNSSGTRGQT